MERRALALTALLLVLSLSGCGVRLLLTPDTRKCIRMAMARSGCVWAYGEMALLQGRQLWILSALRDAPALDRVDVPMLAKKFVVLGIV